ncbi:MAG: FMN-binding negative transcriptional regulator [Armatimonadetes bacterium]|nr:FMN-binding negative transcriptional regulator [Armatimonadota bacterium]
MYPMPEFQEKDRDAIVGFMREYPLATIVTHTEGGLVATHVPVITRIEGDTVKLRGHVMRNTDHWRGFVASPNVLATFHGPNCAIPASWYPERDNGGTWNYMAAHAHGTLTMLPQEDLIEILRELKESNEPDPARTFDTLSQEYLARMLPAIQAFEIKVERLEAVFKLSQNRDDASFATVVRNLTARGGWSADVARHMAARRASAAANQ